MSFNVKGLVDEIQSMANAIMVTVAVVVTVGIVLIVNHFRNR